MAMSTARNLTFVAYIYADNIIDLGASDSAEYGFVCDRS